jgi:hypothetical protein
MASRYRSYVQFLLVLIGLAVILLLPGFAVTRKLGGAEAVVGMFWACGLCFFAAAMGGLPHIVASHSPQEAGILALGSLAMRMGITLFGALGVVLGTDVPRTVFLLWLVMCYFVFLIADVIFVLAKNRPV